MSTDRFTTEQVAVRVAAALAPDQVVNLGIGQPTAILPHVRPDAGIIFHCENGIIGMGAGMADPAEADPDLASAGGTPVSLVTGAAIVHHADSFSLARNGRLDIAILGAYQVAANGDLANWRLPGAKTGNIGGAMDLAAGARQVWVMMTHVDKDGRPKIVEAVTYPVTARACVTRVFTDLAVLSITRQGVRVDELAPGVSFEALQRVTAVKLLAGTR